MYEISAEEIGALTDADLRGLVALLCEAELQKKGLPLAGVTWGGSQTAKDGGIDVRVTCQLQPSEDFVPRGVVGIQVKKDSMPRTALLKEMRPDGNLRPVICDLAHRKGAYIIASGATVSDSALDERREAMAGAVHDLADAKELKLGFYDGSFLATWVRTHPSLISWVRGRVGKTIQGWQPYGAWSRTPAATDPTYLMDEELRIVVGSDSDRGPRTATDGLDEIRALLGVSGRSVRLVGLSGVGKTRLAQALFEEGIGEVALPRSLAFYTDLSDSPNPPPTALASALIESRQRAVLVVDNCQPELHRRITDLVCSSGSDVSLLTIEYDIREDEPEGTDVVRMEPASQRLIARLLAKRSADLPQAVMERIAEFSGGNARIALAIAQRVVATDSLAQLTDEELFARLFHQRSSPDAWLLRIGQAASLVYSFDGEETEQTDAELSILGSLVDMSTSEIFAGIAELRQRDLVQQRGKWRAVLPHAVANRLALKALRSIPLPKVLLALQSSSPRILRSFSRRLSFLHESPEARKIVTDWLAPTGLLGDLATLDDEHRAVLRNVAPVDPGAVLDAIDRQFSSGDDDRVAQAEFLVPILRSVAYEPALFERAAMLLARIESVEIKSEVLSSERHAASSLFQAALSGTHAPLEMRLRVVRQMLESTDGRVQKLGVRAIRSLLKTQGIIGSHEPDFGARPRDHGFHPKSDDEWCVWATQALEAIQEHGLQETPLGHEIRDAIAGASHGLWSIRGMENALDLAFRRLRGKAFWAAGWKATKQVLQFDSNRLSENARERLAALERELRPQDLASKVRAVLARRDILELEELDAATRDYAGTIARATKQAEDLGRDLATNSALLSELLPELFVGGYEAIAIGRGLGSAGSQSRSSWDTLAHAFGAKKRKSCAVLIGYLEGVRQHNAPLADQILDEMVNDSALGIWFPALQRSATLDGEALRRLLQSLELGQAPIEQFSHLGHDSKEGRLSGEDFRRLVAVIATKPGGGPVAREIAFARVFSDRSDRKTIERGVILAGRAAVDASTFGKSGQRSHDDYQLGVLIQECLAGEDGEASARNLILRIRSGFDSYDLYSTDCGHLVRALFVVHPLAVLDSLFGAAANGQKRSVRMLNGISRFQEDLFDGLSEDVLVAWCEESPVRYPLAAAIVPLYRRPKEDARYEWKPLASRLIAKAPDALMVTAKVIAQLEDLSHEGSRAAKLQSSLEFLGRLDVGERPSLRDLVEGEKAKLRTRIDNEKAREVIESRMRDESFE